MDLGISSCKDSHLVQSLIAETFSNQPSFPDGYTYTFINAKI